MVDFAFPFQRSSLGASGGQGAQPLVPSFPGAGDNVLAVSPVDRTGTRAPFSSYGDWTDSGAPGALDSSASQWALVGLEAAEVSEGSEGVYSMGSYGTWGDQGAKPILPLWLPFPLPPQQNTVGITFICAGVVMCYPDDPVEDDGVPNLASGEVCQSTVDMYIASRGPDFVWGRIYRSRTGDDTTIGNNWDHSCNIYLEPYGASIILNDDTGRKNLYHPSEPNTWAADGFFKELTQEDDESFTMTLSHKGTWAFLALNHPNAPGKISAITDRNGNVLTELGVRIQYGSLEVRTVSVYGKYPWESEYGFK